MADKRMIYDFETIFEVIMKSQTDLIEIVTKWSEMLAPTAKDVSFNLSGRDAPLVVPNIQKVVDTINERTLPKNPTFSKINITGQGGTGTITNGGIKFDGESGDARVGSVYDAYGIGGYVWNISENIELRRWPVPRYWVVRSDPAETPTVHILPDVPTSQISLMGDFFIQIPEGKEITLIFHSYRGSRRKTFTNTTNNLQIWHIIIRVSNLPRSGGIEVTGSCILMDNI